MGRLLREIPIIMNALHRLPSSLGGPKSQSQAYATTSTSAVKTQRDQASHITRRILSGPLPTSALNVAAWRNVSCQLISPRPDAVVVDYDGDAGLDGGCF